MKSGNADDLQMVNCYLLDVQALRPGDIILTSSPGQPVSEIIRAVTNSNYSHAILVLNPPYAIESSDFGVVKFRLDRFAVREPQNITVLRVQASVGAKADLGQVVRFAERLVTKEYADREVLAALFERIPRLEQGKFFCSQLVAEAYRSAQIVLVADRRPERTTPGMLANSKILEEVKGILRFNMASELIFFPAFFDGSNRQSPVELETVARQKAFQKVKLCFTKHGHDVSDYFDALNKLAEVWSICQSYTEELDQAFASAIMESGLPYLLGKCYPGHADVFFIDFYVRNAIVLGQISINQQRKLLEYYLSEQKQIQAVNEERSGDVDAFKQAYLSSGLEAVRLHLAGCWEAFITGKRIESAQQRAIEILECSINEAKLA
jgi:hypothetical protein